MTETTFESQFGEEGDEAEHGTSTEYIDPWCDLCYDENGKMIQAYGFCPECNSFICKTCHGIHRKWPIFQNHKILLAGQMPKSQAEKPVKYPDCTRHAGNFTDHYCLDHSEMICSECIIATHKSCNEASLLVICQGLGSADIQTFETLVDAFKQNVLSTKSALVNNVTDIENQKQVLIKQAKEERDKAVSKVVKFFDNTLSNISGACKQTSLYITEQIMTLDNIIHTLEETTTDIKKKLNINFDQNMFFRMQKMAEKVRGYKSEIEQMNKRIKRITLSFSPSSEISTFLSVDKYLGEVKELSAQLCDAQPLPEAVFPHKSALTRMERIINKGCLSQISVCKLASLDIRLMQDKLPCSTRGIDVSSNGVVLVSDWKNKSVKAFSQGNRLLSCLTFSDATCDISVINAKTAAVSTYDKKLHILNISDPSNISIARSISLGYWVTGMTQYKGRLIVKKFDDPQCVKMIDLNGEEKWSVSVDHKGQKLFDQSYTVAVSTHNHTSAVIVSDWGKQTLTLIDPNVGHLIKTIDVTGKGPHGLTCDDYGNVYVCYFRTKEICMFSPDFERSRILLSKSTLRGFPTDIVYYSNSDIIYIAYQMNDTVDCFRFA